jgi:hypothetical protein
MEFTFSLGYLGLALLTLGSIVVGILYYLIGDPQFNLEWVATAIGAFVGGFVASEFVISLTTWEPVFDGLALVPATIGGLVAGGLVAGAIRDLTREPVASSETR